MRELRDVLKGGEGGEGREESEGRVEGEGGEGGMVWRERVEKGGWG